MLYVRAAIAAAAVFFLVGSVYRLASHTYAAGHHGVTVFVAGLCAVVLVGMGSGVASGGGS